MYIPGTTNYLVKSFANVECAALLHANTGNTTATMHIGVTAMFSLKGVSVDASCRDKYMASFAYFAVS